MTRWHLSCDACGAGAWIGPAGDACDAWCEACQQGARVADPGAGMDASAGTDGSAKCPRCARALTTGEPRFEEIFGELQNLAAVLAAWDGDAEPLAQLLPERPRFLTDLDPPPASPSDPPPAREALLALASGAFSVARAQLESLAPAAADARLWRALAIAYERLGEPAAAEAALTRALAHDPSPLLRLQRGALRARRADFPAARDDLSRAGDRFEARWNRAALRLLEAVATTPGLPAADHLALARSEAGEPSSSWSDHTVGRLVWSLLAGRADARARLEFSPCPDARVLRGAEQELEFETFWDRAMVLEGYARLGLAEDAARVAAPLALELARALADEPCLSDDAAGCIAAVFDASIHAISHARAGEACDAITGLLRRPDLKRYRVPCRRCRQGSIGVDRIEETGDEDGAS